MRAATIARLGIGSACLLAPGRVLAIAGGPDRHEPLTQRVARVLGARWVLQGGAELVLGAGTRGVGVLVDLTHAASMLPVAARWPAHRRTALVSAALAAAIVVLDLRDVRWPR
jgi:hypothetical protein